MSRSIEKSVINNIHHDALHVSRLADCFKPAIVRCDLILMTDRGTVHDQIKH